MTADRDSLARLIAREVECSVGWAQPVADAILASDWLAEYVRAKEKEAWDRCLHSTAYARLLNPHAGAHPPTAEPEPGCTCEDCQPGNALR